jgi:hypothetical protein
MYLDGGVLIDQEPCIECSKIWGSCSCRWYVCVLSTTRAIRGPSFTKTCVTLDIGPFSGKNGLTAVQVTYGQTWRAFGDDPAARDKELDPLGTHLRIAYIGSCTGSEVHIFLGKFLLYYKILYLGEFSRNYDYGM